MNPNRLAASIAAVSFVLLAAAIGSISQAEWRIALVVGAGVLALLAEAIRSRWLQKRIPALQPGRSKRSSLEALEKSLVLLIANAGAFSLFLRGVGAEAMIADVAPDEGLARPIAICTVVLIGISAIAAVDALLIMALGRGNPTEWLRASAGLLALAVFVGFLQLAAAFEPSDDWLALVATGAIVGCNAAAYLVVEWLRRLGPELSA